MVVEKRGGREGRSEKRERGGGRAERQDTGRNAQLGRLEKHRQN
jgi:hypothetical protein